MRLFSCERLHFQIFWTSSALGLHIWKNFGLWLDLDWVFKNQDWIWIPNMTVRSSLQCWTWSGFRIEIQLHPYRLEFTKTQPEQIWISQLQW